MGSRIAQKVFAIHQPEEVLILLGQSLISRLCDILERHLHGG